MNKDFTQKTVIPFTKENQEQVKGIIKADNLLSLIKDDDLRAAIIKYFELDELNFYIQIGNIDFALKHVAHYTSKYEYIDLMGPNKGVRASIVSNNEGNGLFFTFSGFHTLDGEVQDDFSARSIYTSMSTFYEDRKLTQFMNYIKNGDKSFTNGIQNYFLNGVDKLWRDYYQNNPEKKQRKYGFLKDSGKYFLRRITSDNYKNYGVALSFVLTTLELDKIMKRQKGLEFRVSLLSLNESKIDMIITQNKKHEIPELNSIMSSSFYVSNDDIRQQAVRFQNTITLTRKNSPDSIFLFPRKDQNKDFIDKTALSHLATRENLLKYFDRMDEMVNSMEAHLLDFKEFKGAKTPDELKVLIARRVLSKNSIFKDSDVLRKLFTREMTKTVDQLTQLIDTCQKASLLISDNDLRFKLWYIVSNVILYGTDRD